MSIYRLYKGGKNTLQGWSGTPNTPYDARAISTIKDSNGAVSSKEITSIPSPFARIDLIRAAFAEINQACNGKVGHELCIELSKDTIYHKMVSDSLDVGEIFFNIDKYADQIEIITWNPRSDQMANAGNNGQSCYANSLNTYWQADGATYNFAKVQNIYILNYINGPAPLNVIGATSPATLFFSNANNLDYVKNIQFGQDIPFDQKYQPLYKRDPKYVEYLWWLKHNIQDFPALFPEVDRYIDYTYAAISAPNQRESLLQIHNLNANVPLGFSCISATSNNVTNSVEVLGFQLYQKSLKPIGNSDFTIKSTRQPQSTLLVLPVESGNKYADWMYTTDKWGTQNAAPAFNNTPISNRKLPNDNTQQPYLTISDFLEDTILLSPHKLNNKLFFNGDFDGDRSYLLPLKPFFFEFFTVDDLVDNKMFKMQKRAAGTVSVTLEIPTIKGKIEYSRLYSTGSADPVKNEGLIIEEEDLFDCEFLIIPAVATPNNVQPYYTVASVAPFERKIEMCFFQKGKIVLPKGDPQIRNKNYKDLYKSSIYTLDEKFECFQIRTRKAQNMVLPLLREKAGNDAYSFAVDLGTSNTHIEYVINDDARKCLPFEYSDSRMVGLLFLPHTQSIRGEEREQGLEEVRSVIDRDLLPKSLSSDEVYHFPTRTALSYAKNINWNIKSNPMELGNLSLPFGKLMPLSYNDYATNIKWSDDPSAQEQIHCYIENVLLLLRNKVLTSGGDLSKSKLTWFYPTSMIEYRRGLFQRQWSEAFKIFFGHDAEIYCISESLAPVQFHTQNNSTAKDMLTIDIGGGTTDIAFASKGKVECVTSFRFAANALFEDSFSRTNGKNGIIDFYKPHFFELAQDIEELKSILSAFDTSSTNMANTLFTLADVPCVRKKNFAADKIDFITKLRNDSHFKLEVIIFYAAILYHAGKILKAKEMPLPRHIAFSGNGSNILKVLATADNYGKQQLAKLSKIVIELAVGDKYVAGAKLDILGFDAADSPKQATCKGGLLQGLQTETPQTVILKSASNTLLDGETYAIVTNEYVNHVQNEISNFFNVLSEVNGKLNFTKNFGVSNEAQKILEEILSAHEDINTFIHNGIKSRMEKENAIISETFFFYPIACILQQFSLDMFNELKP